MRWPWERLAALGGIVAVALWIIGGLVIDSAGSPDDDDPAAILARYADEESTLLAGGFLFQLGSIAFLIFLAALVSRLWWAEGGTGFLSTLALAGGIGAALLIMGAAAPTMAGALAGDDLVPEAAQALNTLDDMFFIMAELSAGLFVAAVGLLALRARALPAWLGWISLVLALWLLIPPIGWIALIFVLPLWTLVVSVLLYLPKPIPPPGPPPHSAGFVGTE